MPVKSVPQQVLTSLHRLRQGWVAKRTARLSALRGLLRELGVFIPVGAEQVVPALWALIEDADLDLPDALRPVFAAACQEIREIEGCIKQVERQLEAMAQQLPAVVYLLSIPGIGLLTATALVAFIGDVRRFPSGRHLASYLWAHELEKTQVHNKAAVAVANKLARIVWAVWSRQQPYGQVQSAA